MTNEKEILRKAVDTYGGSSQTDMMIEEMSELTKALLKLRRATKECDMDAYDKALKNIHEEMADVNIMLEQTELIYGSYRKEKAMKLARLEKRLNGSV